MERGARRDLIEAGLNEPADAGALWGLLLADAAGHGAFGVEVCPLSVSWMSAIGGLAAGLKREGAVLLRVIDLEGPVCRQAARPDAGWRIPRRIGLRIGLARR